MQRRDFIFKSLLASAGTLLLPSVFASCKKGNTDELDAVDFNGQVLIIGAGAAGLYAGKLLQDRGIPFEILEAADRYGGRLGKTTTFADYPIDMGAQWLHGNKSETADMINQAGMHITRDNADLSFWFNGQLANTLPRNPFIFEESGLPDVSFLAATQAKGFDAEYRYIIEAIAADYGADAADISAYWNYVEFENWSSGNKDYKFRDTYFDFLDREVAQAVQQRIRLNTVVAGINYMQDRVVVTDTQGTEHVADKVLITVPVTQLQKQAIAFTPALPADKTAAFGKLGMGPGMKVFLRFTDRFYPDTLVGGSTCATYIDDTLGKQTNEHVLLAFVMGQQAAALSALGSDAAITAALLAELDTMLGGAATPRFIDALVIDWGQTPFIEGAYSYSTMGMGNARSVAARAVDKKLYFAGEAMNTSGHHQTVHGAMESAKQQVRQLLLDTLE